MTSEPNITRMDYARTHGWWVRIYRTERGNQVCHSKHFGDTRNGGKRKALLAARAWRDARLKALPESESRNPSGACVPPGHGYVKRVEMLRRKARYPAWCAWLRIEERRCKATSYAVSKWGERGAKRRAQQWLTEQRAELGRRLRAVSPR